MDSLSRRPEPVHLLAAGTRGQVTLEDCLCAGIIARRLIAAGRPPGEDDPVRIAVHLAEHTGEDPSKILDALRASRGGRNLTRLGLNADIVECARIDTHPIVPVLRFDPALGPLIVAAP